MYDKCMCKRLGMGTLCLCGWAIRRSPASPTHSKDVLLKKTFELNCSFSSFGRNNNLYNLKYVNSKIQGGASPSPLLRLFGIWIWSSLAVSRKHSFFLFSPLCPYLPHSSAHVERLMELLTLWRRSLGVFWNVGVRLTCVYVMIIRAKQSFLFIICIQRHFSYMRTTFDPLPSDLTECLNFSLASCERQCLHLLGIF